MSYEVGLTLQAELYKGENMRAFNKRLTFIAHLQMYRLKYFLRLGKLSCLFSQSAVAGS
jgi:hypothetical protein